MRCDAVVCKQGERAKATIPPRTRREVLSRDGHRCRAPGCIRTHFLEVHHKTSRARGGTHDPSNLITLCAACHRLHHEKGTLVREPAATWVVKAPGGPPRPMLSAG
ncbi:MAG: HNH endonuclease [bacterium]|nr:HNH endonuclease [bacterium]